VYQGEPLARRAARVALEAGCALVVVVVGAMAQAVTQAVEGMGVIVAENPDWEKGPGTSVKVGLKRLLQERLVDGVLITLVDQPLIEAVDLRRLMESGGEIAAAEFGGTVGAPAYFESKYFERLAALEDGAGAKAVLLAAGEQLKRVVMERAGSMWIRLRNFRACNDLDEFGCHRSAYSPRCSTQVYPLSDSTKVSAWPKDGSRSRQRSRPWFRIGPVRNRRRRILGTSVSTSVTPASCPTSAIDPT
jgi:CTP:molybdopterin cytidylyltransferase MocA